MHGTVSITPKALPASTEDIYSKPAIGLAISFYPPFTES